jgi:L-iditol 2-dehydrogenase
VTSHIAQARTDSTPSATSDVMRAAVLSQPRVIELRDVPRPEPARHEALIRVTAVGLCGTDFHIYSGEANYNRDDRGRAIPLSEASQILGHEITGVVEAVGSAVNGLRVGDRVVVDQGRNCVSESRSPRCEYCATGNSHQCEHYREHGITGLPGGLAEYLAIPAVNAVAIESNIDPAAAVLAEPLGCIVHSMDLIGRTPARYALARQPQGGRVRSILISGAGPSGLLFVQYLRRVLHFDGVLLVSDPNETKRKLASRFGAESIDPASANLADAVQDRTQGRRVEMLIEASGAGDVFASIPQLVRKQATLVLYGHGHGGSDLSVLNAIQFLEPTMLAPTGASGGFEPDGRPSTYVRALGLIESGAIDASSLITHRYRSLDAVPDAFAGEHRAPTYVKGVVTL